MFLHKTITIVACLLFIVVPVEAWQPSGAPEFVIHGDILEVFPDENRVRVLSEDKEIILALDQDTEITRSGQSVRLASLRPITPRRYQEGLFFINSQGMVSRIFVHYYVYQDERGLVSTDIFGKVKEIEQLQ